MTIKEQRDALKGKLTQLFILWEAEFDLDEDETLEVVQEVVDRLFGPTIGFEADPTFFEGDDDSEPSGGNATAC